MYGYQGYVPGQSTTYTTSAVAAAVAAAYSGSAQPPAPQGSNVFGYPSATSFPTGVDPTGAAASNAYYAYGYNNPAAPSAAVQAGYPNIAAAGANYASLSDLSFAAKGRAPYGSTAPKPNPALTTLTTANKPISSYGSTYDAAVYAAASNMMGTPGAGRGTFPPKKKNPFSQPGTGGAGGGSGGGMGAGSAPTHKYGNKRWGLGATATTHRDAQQFYCEVCKISCAGQLTYKEHLEGKLHKKKELLAKGEGTQALPRSKVSFRCDLCNVTCTGKDTYDAHVRGSKHQRTLALCKKLGKPIPAGEPTIIAPAEMGGTIPPPAAGTAKAGAVPKAAAASAKIPTIGAAAAAGKKIAPVHFVGGSSLETTKNQTDIDAKKAAVAAAVGSAGSAAAAADPAKKEVEYDLNALLAADNNVKPVGENFVETERDANGKHLTYVCKLCDCKFSDINAKDIHLKGRRHRLQYKQKVDPTLVVEMKPNTLREKRAARLSMEKGPGKYMGPPSVHMGGPMGPFGPNGMGRFAPALPPRPYFDAGRYMETEDDRHIMMKHASLFPNEEQLKGLEEIVQSIEKGLKGLSDLYETNKPKTEEATVAGDRLLKGAMRIGMLSAGLAVAGEEEVQLVTLFSKPPTVKQLQDAANDIKQFITLPDYTVEVLVDEAALLYTVKDRLPRVKCYFTSTVLRQDESGSATGEKPTDCLPEEKCLYALAELRHSKWFQVRCTGLQSCQVVLRVLRDVARRIQTYTKLSPWMTQLIVEKVIASVGVPIPVGDALRRFFEALSTGILFESGPGVLDPCEKETVNVLASLSAQDRENITSSAQHALRLIAFGQIHKILGMEKMVPAPSPPNGERKRPRQKEANGAAGDAKKDKPDEEEKKASEGEEKKENENAEKKEVKIEPKALNVKMETN
ncbi:hypothetical protein PFISCL1PPCAC_22429 [Pristionchus fissidentatus]|uniref:DZF domain-containing protein n=1 Tax=Pristionchus fissidentatus TaxID=1538716 RepID=A0AAV5WGX7_9BILA|nr:hypothetical protein PFISCL1PPCAC_22429 [Pristionchus fissidentatus]